MYFILQIFWIIFILFIWFETDGFVEYSRFLGLSKLFKIDRFDQYKKENNPKITYLSYIRQNHSSFITRLVTCAPCLNFWITLAITVIYNDLFMYPVVYLVSYLLYRILKKQI